MSTTRKLFRRLPPRNFRGWAACGLSLWFAAFQHSARAQYTTDYQTNTISAVVSNWPGDYLVGNTNFSDVLLIQSSGVLSNGASYVGYAASSSNNSVLVTDSGSAWSNRILSVGWSGAGNSLVISNGGRVVSLTSGGESSYIGVSSSSSNNNVLVTGSGSVWNGGDGALIVGSDGASNSLVISNGAQVFCGGGNVGSSLSASNSSALVTGSGSAWNNSGSLRLAGMSNTLVLSDGGKVVSSGAWIVGMSNDTVLVTGTGSVWSNSGWFNIAEYGSGNSLVISNGGRVINNIDIYNHRDGYVGEGVDNHSNRLVITGTGSVWSNSGNLYIAYDGASNSLVISSGGRAINNSGYVGYQTSGILRGNSSALVTDANSVWTNLTDLYVGWSVPNNSLTISNGGRVVNGYGYVGYNSSSSNNSALVTGTGSVWKNRNDLSVGSSGASNSLVIANSGQVLNGNGYVGYNSSSTNNSVLVSGTGSIWTNLHSVWVGWSGAGNRLVISNGGQVVSPIGQTSCGLGDNSSSSNNSVLVTGTGSVWKAGSDFSAGGYGRSNALVISDGGQVLDGNGEAGGHSDSNSVLVTGAGSVWSNGNAMYIGDQGSGNRLVISNGGLVISGGAASSGLGSFTVSSNNSVLVTDTGSVWSNRSALNVGFDGLGNRLVISNGGQVVSEHDAYVGNSPSSSNNSARVVDGGIWQNNVLYVGYHGSGNSLVVDGGSVLATNLTIGFSLPICDNLVELDNGSLIVTNATGTGVLEVRNGQLILNGGVLQVDRFVMTNACAQFLHTGGTLIYGTAVLDPTRDDDGDGIPNGWEQAHGLDPLNFADANADSDGDGFTNLQEFQAGTDPTNSASSFRITSLVSTDQDILVTWTMGTAKTNALQAAAGDGGSYTNTFADIFTVTNTAGTVTNYLDPGAATNSPSRYYRVRLVP